MSDSLRSRAIRLAASLPEGDAVRRELLAAVGKTANWWGVIHITQQSDTVHVDVAGEQPVGGASSLTYVMSQAQGRIRKLSDEVEDFMVAQADYSDSHVSKDPSLAVVKDSQYVGYGHMHVFKWRAAAVAAVEALQVAFKSKAYIRNWALHI